MTDEIKKEIQQLPWENEKVKWMAVIITSQEDETALDRFYEEMYRFAQNDEQKALSVQAFMYGYSHSEFNIGLMRKEDSTPKSHIIIPGPMDNLT